MAWYEEDSCGRPIKVISQTQWDGIYKKQMDPVRDYLKENKDEMLKQLNNQILLENWNKYCDGTISKWEMDSIGFYYHEHELANIDEYAYHICDFNELSTQPEIDRIIVMQGKEIPMYKLHCLAGTVVDKNKNKNSITLLTKYGVVNVKIYQAQYAKFDKQISEKNPDGTKTVKEKSWFTRGTKLLVTGIRRDDTFQLKKYKNTPGEVVQRIVGIDEEDGLLCLQSKRYGE
jgi:DNA polymerase-3 subunit alpha